jgi:hypothetical protein
MKQPVITIDGPLGRKEHCKPQPGKRLNLVYLDTGASTGRLRFTKRENIPFSDGNDFSGCAKGK